MRAVNVNCSLEKMAATRARLTERERASQPSGQVDLTGSIWMRTNDRNKWLVAGDPAKPRLELYALDRRLGRAHLWRTDIGLAGGNVCLCFHL